MATYLKLLILILLASCVKAPQGQEVYIIEKNKNYSNGNKLIGQVQTFDVYIDYMWWYDDKIPDAHWNKLIGFSEDSHHHKNSLRVAWRSTDKQIRFALYAYVDGQRVIKEFTARHRLESRVTVSMFREGDKYHVILNGEQLTVDAALGRDYSYSLFPYFGGEAKAPHRIRFVFTFNN